MTLTSPEAVGGATGPRRLHPLALAAALCAVAVPVISFVSVTVALGEIGAELHASPGVLQLVVAAYGVVYASLVVIGGRLGDSHGRRRMLSIGLVLFAVTGLLCAVAQSSEVLVGARLLQGATAALVAPQVLASIHANTDGHHRVHAMALFGATAGVAFSVAFLAGGVLTDSSLGWRSLFWVTSALVAIVIVVVVRYLPESKAPAPSRLDIGGAALLGILMTLLVLPLTEGRALGWPAWTWVCLAGTPVAAAAFVWWQARLERRAAIPLVPLSLFRFRSVSAGLGTGLPMYVAFSGFTFIFSITAATRGLSAVQIGASMLPLGLAFLATSVVSGRLTPRFGTGVLTSGAVLGAAGFALVSRAIAALEPASGFSPATVAVGMVVIGAGFGLLWSPLMGIALSQVPSHLAGLGGGLLITVMQVGLALGSALVGALYLSWDGDFARTGYVLAVAMLAVGGLTLTLPRRTAG